MSLINPEPLDDAALAGLKAQPVAWDDMRQHARDCRAKNPQLSWPDHIEQALDALAAAVADARRYREALEKIAEWEQRGS